MKVKLLQNRDWFDWGEAVGAVQEWYWNNIQFEFDVQEVDIKEFKYDGKYLDVPWASKEFFDGNYDIIVLVMPIDLWTGQEYGYQKIVSKGRNKIPFIVVETDGRRKDPHNRGFGNQFQATLRHELAHALYYLSGFNAKDDRVHELDYNGKLSEMWKDINLKKKAMKYYKPLIDVWYVTQPFGAKADRYKTYHHGLDLRTRTEDNPSGVGTPVYAAADGLVERVQLHPEYGRHIRIQHDNGSVTLYAHLSKSFVEFGQRVNENTMIALSGGDPNDNIDGDGQSTAAHLHFEIRENGTYESAIDPLPLLEDRVSWEQEAREFAIKEGISNGERPHDPIKRVELWQTLKSAKEKGFFR